MGPRGLIVTSLLAVSLLAVGVTGQQNSSLTECYVDVTFLLDESSSMFEEEFTSQLDFVDNILHAFPDFGQAQGSRLGLVVFASRSTIIFDMDKFTDRGQASTVINDKKFRGGITNTHLGLRQLRQVLNTSGRKDVKKVGVLMTDGVSDAIPETLVAAQAIHADGSDLIVIAIGATINETLLRNLPSQHKYYLSTKFETLNDQGPLSPTAQLLDWICPKPVACPTPPTTHKIPSFEQQQGLSLIKANVDSVGVLVGDPFNPLKWSSRGLCAANDTEIVGDTRALTNEVRPLVVSSSLLLPWKQDCYTSAIGELRSELQRQIKDCKLIAKWTMCTVKIVKNLGQAPRGGLVGEGTVLANKWDHYSSTFVKVGNPTEATRVINMQRLAVNELRAKLQDATPAERTILQNEINAMEKVIELNQLKLDYSDLKSDMKVELARAVTNNALITTLQSNMLNKLKMMRSKSDDAAERSAMLTFIGSSEKLINMNNMFQVAKRDMITEQNKNIHDQVRFVASQKAVHDELTNMLTSPETTRGRDSIAVPRTQLGMIITRNVLITQYNNITNTINTLVQTSPHRFNTILNAKMFSRDKLREIGDVTPDADKHIYTTALNIINRDITRNTLRGNFTMNASQYDYEVARPPSERKEVGPILGLMIGILTQLRAVTDAASERASIDRDIALFTKAKACYDDKFP